MRILYILDSLTSGGAEKLVVDIVNSINGRDDIIIELLLLTDKNSVYLNNLPGVSIYVVPLKSCRNPLNVIFIMKYLLKHKYDLIHVHLFPATYWVSFAKKILKEKCPPIIMTEHSTYNKRRNYKFLRIIEKSVYKEFNQIVSIGATTQNNLKKWLNYTNVNSGRYHIIDNGVDIAKYEKAVKFSFEELKELGIHSKLNICMIGRFCDSKDHITLVNAFKRLPDNIGLILIGEGSNKKKIHEVVDEYGLTDRVVFTGYRNDVERFVKTADVIVHSVNWEGFGLVAVECMAAGKPIIATNVDGLSEIVGGAGILFSSNDVDTLIKEILKLLEIKKYYEFVSIRCYERAKQYSIENTSTKYTRLYNQMISVN